MICNKKIRKWSKLVKATHNKLLSKIYALYIVESLISKIIKPTFHFELSIYNFGSKYLDSR